MAFRLGLRRGGYPAILLATSTFVGHVIQQLGSDFHKAEVLPALASGEAVICLGYTEPDSGSDVMAARTKAVLQGDEWVIDGTKMFTTGAHLARYTFLLARTDPDVAKHKGLTMFLVPLDTPGITINPVRTISDERSNAVFYDGVRVHDRWRIGDLHGGVHVLALALQIEQGTSFLTDLECLYSASLAWARASAKVEDPVVRGAIAELALDIELSKLLLEQGVWRRAAGVPDEGRGPMSKLFSSERLIEHTGVMLDLMGEAGCLISGTHGAVGSGEAERLYRFAPGTTIYGGTSEILRSRIAETGLGLARSRG
jgi:alkylation response protein AidB-like acyl-CoA dehydrogenase